MLFRITLFACLLGAVSATALGIRGNANQAKPVPDVGDALSVPAGFEIELVHTVDPKTEGSWIFMAKDHKGRLIISGQQNQPILRITLKDGRAVSIEKLKLPSSGAMGMLYAFESLYVNGIGSRALGCIVARTRREPINMTTSNS